VAAPDVPDAVFERVEAMCSALPEVTLRTDKWAHAFEVRRRVFTFLLSAADAAGTQMTALVVSADVDERRALLAIGHPYFPPSSGERRLGIVVDDATDWDEVAELIIESYRLTAPKKLSALLD
jgi:hypothetical protein